MPCDPEELKHVPLFETLDDEELAILAQQVELRKFSARQRIYKIGDPGERGYLMISGKVQVVTFDEDQQEVVIDEPIHGDFFGFAAMLDQMAHQTTATALEDTICVEVDRNDITTLLHKKPMAGMDMMSVLGRQFHASQRLVRLRAARNPNEVIEEKTTFGQHIADRVAAFGGSWMFINSFLVVLIVYSSVNIALRAKAWDPYPFILLNLFLSMLAALQAPIIMMSQNRQDQKDRVRSELDFDVNRRAEIEIQGLARKLNLLTDKVDDMVDLVRPTQPSGGANGRG